jgi:hypothetical protein
MTKYVIRKGSLAEELYLQPAGHWGRYDTARRFSTQDKATQCAEKLGIGENYGIFDAGARKPVKPGWRWNLLRPLQATDGGR